jgi:inhibitor of KinA
MGIDLDDIARHLGMTPDELVKLHHAQDYRIYMIGFLPGFPYLGSLPEQLHTQRKKSPVQVPAGSVAIAGRQTGIYPFHSPGGWNVIGRTPLTLFDPYREPPVFWKAGDRVRFIPIGIEEFNNHQHHS